MNIFINILILLLSSYVSGKKSISSCPQIFQYRNDGIVNYATVTIPNPGPGPGPVQLDVLLSVRGKYGNAGGMLYLRKSEEDSINDILSGRPVEYLLDFPRSLIQPYLTTIKLNGVPICLGGHHYKDDLIWIKHTFTYDSNFVINNQIIDSTSQDSPVYEKPGLVAQPMYDRRKAKFLFSSTCGVSPVKLVYRPVHTIIGGSPVLPGEYPWLVSLNHIERNRKKPKCGATLVSDRHVITAAHCVFADMIYLELGLHEMKNSREMGVVGRNVSKIHMHPDYRNMTGDGDIAVLEMSKPVTFSKRIMPACIWPYDRDVYHERGYVVGWGVNETDGDFTETPTQADVNIMDQTNCRENALFRKITSNITFCAGGARKGPCVGDSGSGMYYYYEKKWYLRGVISISISQGGGSCDVTQSSVFADIAKLLTWIKKYID